MIPKLKDILNEDLFNTSLKMKPHEKLIVSAAIEFMKKKFGFNSKIIVKKKEKQGLLGDITLNDNSLNKNTFYLHFNSNATFPTIIKSLLHELTHVKQVSKGELKPSSDYKNLLWKNKPIISVKDYNKMGKTDFQRYKKMPWEKDAYDNMVKLYKPFLSSTYWTSLKGKDVNLDYIIDNI